MATSGLIRLGGLAAMLVGVAYSALGLLVPFLAPLFFSLLALGATAAIVALHILQGGRYGLPGALASSYFRRLSGHPREQPGLYRGATLAPP